MSKKIRKFKNKELLEKINQNNFAFNIDITKIDISILKAAYIDFRLLPIPITVFDNTIYNVSYIKEALGDIQLPDTVVQDIRNKYQLPEQLVRKIELHNNIYIYTIVATIGINDKLIEDDMNKLGYFLGVKGNIQHVNNMKFRILQFEPTSQIQKDSSDEIKLNNNYLYHLTPNYNITSIIKNGLIPSHKNKLFNYPERTYLIKENSSDEKIKYLGERLCNINKDPQNNGEYILLKIKLENLPDNIKFYYDPNSSLGIFTEQIIPYSNIEIYKKYKFNK